jgi:CHAT domain-containing protein
LLVCQPLLTAGCRTPIRLFPERAYRQAWLKVRQGNLSGAASDVDVALKTFSTPNTDWNLRFTELKAEILVRQRSTNEALALLASPLPSFLATSDLAVWRKLTEAMANVYSLRFDEGEELLGVAETLARQYHPALLGEVALRRGTLAFWRGDAALAESAYRSTLQLARARHDLFLETAALGSLGLAATKQEHYDESIQWNRQALDLSRTIGAKDSESYILGNMGWGYFEIGDYDRALEMLQRAEESSRKAGSTGAQIDWLVELGGVDYYLHDYDAAEHELQHAIALARQLDDKSAITAGLNNLCVVALKKGDLPLAEKYNDEALNLSRTAKDHSGELSSTLLQGRIEIRKQNYPDAIHFLRQVFEDLSAETPLRWEAQARLAEVYRAAHQAARANAAYLQSIATIESARASIEDEELRVAFLSNAIEFYDDYIDLLVAQGKPREALEIAELSRARTLAEGLGAAPKTLSFPLRDFEPREIARRTKSVLLFYWLGQKQSYLWVITPEKVTCLTLAGATEIDPLVKSYREAVLGGRDVLAAGNSEGEKLYSLLVEPAKKLIPPDSRVILLPDGSLYGLNFEILLDPSPKPHFWIEDVTVTTASSLTLLSAGRNARKQDAGATSASERRDVAGTFRYGNLLLVGDATQAAAEFPVLRQAQAEIAQVGRYFPEARRAILSGAHATPIAFLSSMPEKFAYLHFVTHGSASRAHPLDSAVILSPDGDSFKLYARDIVKHPLSAYLVTVSACNGSGTRAYSGEGLVGLSWAFLRAGAHNVIAALWEVNDASTPQLMDKLYGELSEGRDPATALRAAKLSLLHSDSVFSKPFYWAPFQLYAGS